MRWELARAVQRPRTRSRAAVPVRHAIHAASPSLVFNVSDLLLDRSELLASYSRAAGIDRPLPRPSDASAYNAMDCSRLKALGWTPRQTLDLGGLV